MYYYNRTKQKKNRLTPNPRPAGPIDLISDDVTVPTADCANVEDIGGSFEATIVGYLLSVYKWN